MAGDYPEHQYATVLKGYRPADPVSSTIIIDNNNAQRLAIYSNADDDVLIAG